MKPKTLVSLISFKNLNSIITIVFVCLIFLSSCEKEKPIIEYKNELIGTWKFIGFGNTDTGTFRDVEKPENCDDCYIFSFRTDVDILVILTPHSGDIDPPQKNIQRTKNLTKLPFFS
jgi:hypothetical protein